MTDPDQKAFLEKFSAFLLAHQRVVADFTRSLGTAKTFLNLAPVSMEKEPDETVIMLEQILEIDLLGHLGRQFEEFHQVAGLLLTPQADLENPGLMEQLRKTRAEYEELMAEAEQQMATIETLLTTLNTPN
ncbi:MAG: hypothetical protein OEW39_13170 [Deltaproteobacteria bacterium]|nr:hypothetical protein [Deltaproteobacteria bacterium]